MLSVPTPGQSDASARHGREVLAERRQCPHDRLVGRTWQLAPSALPTLAAVLVEHGLAVAVEVAGPQVQHLGTASTHEHEREDDRAVAQTSRCLGDHRKQRPHLLGAESARRRRDNLRSLQRVARVRSDDPHTDEEAVEGGEARDPRADCDRRGLLARETDAVRLGEHVLLVTVSGGLPRRRLARQAYVSRTSDALRSRPAGVDAATRPSQATDSVYDISVRESAAYLSSRRAAESQRGY